MREKGINVPNVKIKLPAITEKDKMILSLEFLRILILLPLLLSEMQQVSMKFVRF